MNPALVVDFIDCSGMHPAWRRPTLPGPCGPSTIGAGGLNGRVRDGYAWNPSAVITRPDHLYTKTYALKTGCEPDGAKKKVKCLALLCHSLG